MNTEAKALIKGLIVGTGVAGAGGILIGTSIVPGTLLLLLAILANIVVNNVWSNDE